MKKVILRYTVAQRVFHWVNAIACIVLLMTGLGIYAPGLFGNAVSTGTWFVWHSWFAVLLMVGVVFHFIHDSLIEDAFGFMWIGKEEVDTLKQVSKNFLGTSKVYPKYGKYNPMQIASHWMFTGSIFALILTGLILWKPTRFLFPLELLGLGWGFIYFCRILHDFFAAALLALIIGHVYFALFIKKNWSVSKSIITGKIDYAPYIKYHTLAREVPIDVGSEAEGVQN
jgi:formate dehydrogenase subunit gamma